MKRIRCTKNEIHLESQQPPKPPTDSYLEDDSKNPMLNPVILGHLFEVIPFNCREFKNFRQVSKLWLEASLGRWRQEVWLHVRDGPRRENNPCQFYKPYLELLSLAGDPHQLLGKFAFRKYRLSTAYYGHSKFFGEDALLPFWSKVGPFLTHLKVIETSLGAGELVMRIFIEMAPNMRFLSLEQSHISIPWRGQPYPLTADEMWEVNVPAWCNRFQPEAPEVQKSLTHFEISRLYGNFGISWAYFFLRFPSIQTLKLTEVPWRRPNRLRDYNADGNDELLRVFESLQIIRTNGRQGALSQLEHLNLLNVQQEAVSLFWADVLTLLSQLDFPLSSLSIDIGFEQDVAGFRRILELCSSTLQKLVVYRGPYAEPFTENFPYGIALPYLKKLTFVGPICGNLHFLENTPSLKTLVLLDGQTPMEPELLNSYVEFSFRHFSDKQANRREFSNKVDVVSSTNFSSEPMKSLVLPQLEEFIVGHELCDGAQIEALGKLMPGLKKLRIGLGNEGFAVACKSWTQLRYLDIEPFDLEEEGILGIEDGKKYSQPNITDMKYLMSLRMGVHSSNDSKKGRLTNGSIVDGLLVAESLRSVVTARALKASQKVRDMFASKFPQ